MIMLLFPKAMPEPLCEAVSFRAACSANGYASQIVSLYIDIHDPANAEIISLALAMLTVATISQILDAVQKITCGALQGLQDTRIPVLLNIPAFWFIGLTSGYLLSFYFNLGGVGLWIGQSIGVAVAASLFLIRWQQKLA